MLQAVALTLCLTAEQLTDDCRVKSTICALWTAIFTPSTDCAIVVWLRTLDLDTSDGAVVTLAVRYAGRPARSVDLHGAVA